MKWSTISNLIYSLEWDIRKSNNYFKKLFSIDSFVVVILNEFKWDDIIYWDYLRSSKILSKISDEI